MKLYIKQSSWSGRSKNYKPVELEEQYDIKLNKKYVIKTLKISYVKEGKMIYEEKEIFSFEIIEINSDNIKIHTFQAFSDNEDDSINLRSTKMDFNISKEKPLKLVTLTMDYGDIFILKLIK